VFEHHSAAPLGWVMLGFTACACAAQFGLHLGLKKPGR
jgi:hypothetical protein